MQIGHVHHLEYYVRDLSASREFWDWFLERLGYAKMSEWASGVSWAHSSGTYLVFVQVADSFLSLSNTRHGVGLNHIAFQGGSLTWLDQLQAELEKRQVRILKRNGAYLCFEELNSFAVEVYAVA